MTPLLSDLFYFASQILPRRNRYQFAASDLPTYSDQFSVLIYNVNYESSSNNNTNIYTKKEERSRRSVVANKILNAITQSEADIVLLQETNQAWEELLLSSEEGLLCSPTKYPHFCFHHPNSENNDRKASGMAILSRYPISNVQIYNFYSKQDPLLSGSVFPAMTACIEETPLGNLEVANIHLRPPLELDGSATFSTARTTGPIREAEISQLLKQQQQNENRTLDIVAGDFNEQDGEDALRRLREVDAMVDSLQEYVPANKETHRWPFGRYLTMHKRLDHICYRSRPAGGKIKCVGCGVISGYEVDASDHQPVLARFVPSSQREVEYTNK